MRLDWIFIPDALVENSRKCVYIWRSRFGADKVQAKKSGKNVHFVTN